MRLTPDEKKMLRGGEGAAVKQALELQIEVGKFFGAKRLVPVSNVHMMGDIEVMGDGGKAFLERMSAAGAHCAVPTTTNARCIDFDYVANLRQNQAEAAKARHLFDYL